MGMFGENCTRMFDSRLIFDVIFHPEKKKNGFTSKLIDVYVFLKAQHFSNELPFQLEDRRECVFTRWQSFRMVCVR